MESFYAKVRNVIIPETPQADEIDEKKPILDQSNLTHQKTETNQLECLYCFGVFASSEDLSAHKSIHHKTKKYICKWCNVTYSYVGWRYHYLKHTNDTRYSCKSCNKKFILLQQLQSHLAHHKYSCSFCNETFVTIKQICAHRKSVHNIDAETCSFVSKLTQKRAKRSKNKLKIHRERNLSEDFSESFLKKTDLNMSNVKKSFRCEKCRDNFPKMSLLRNHIKKNWNCRPYSCHDCGSKFIQKKILEKHVRKHLHKCSVCSKSFPNKNYLDVHFYNKHMLNVDLHIKSEVFTCRYCGLAFQSEEDLQNHIKVTGENIIICARCINMFETESDFEFHLKTEHNIDADI